MSQSSPETRESRILDDAVDHFDRNESKWTEEQRNIIKSTIGDLPKKDDSADVKRAFAHKVYEFQRTHQL